MGSSNWSDAHYSARREHLAASGKTLFDHDKSIRTGKAVAAAHSTLDPTKMKAGVRECRDSDAHPETTPIVIGLDVTGSMRETPVLVQKKLKELMGLLLRKGYVNDPSICVLGIGDAEINDKVPFQVGQFESGIELDESIDNLYLEGGGGGNKQESTDLAIYYLARKVVADSWEKRNKKGYAFIITDEALPQRSLKNVIQNIFGDTVQSDIPINELIVEAMEKWNLFCIVPNMTEHYRSSLQNSWSKYLGQHVLYLDDPNTICETIAACIGTAEDNISDLAKDLQDVGLNSNQVGAVTKAISTIKPRTDISKLSGTGLTTL